MREIKFRGYSSMLNKWIYGPGMKFDKSGKASIFYNNGWYNVGNTGGQFTGLTDRNGKEIYEGGIVECFKEGLSEVKFIDSTFGLYTSGIGFEPFFNVYGYCEVIGNIHEHKHLLEGVK